MLWVPGMSVLPPLTLMLFFLSKGVDYRGEEVKVAQRICWDSISPAFPPEVGGVSLLDFCTLGTKILCGALS